MSSPLAESPSHSDPEHAARPPAIVGSHPAIQNIRHCLPRLAASRSPVIIVGEPGTGKTLIARHIHHLTGNTLPLTIINLAVLPDRDQRLALFGGEPPEFSSTYRGSLEEETTVLVKNVDRASAYIRDRLRACLTGLWLRRPGSSVDRPVRCRVIFTMSQTPRRLMRTCKGDSSMKEFFRRLRILVVPPLKRRPEDLPELLGALLLRRSLIRGAFGQNLSDNLHDLLAMLDVVCPPAAETALDDRERRAFARVQRAITDGREFSLRLAMASLEATLARRAISSSSDCRQAVARRLGMSARTLERMTDGST